MGNSTDKCFNCKHFQRYYIKGVKKFNRTKLGRCLEKCETVNSGDGCELFCQKREKREELKRELLNHSLNDILTQLSSIRNIIEDENEEL